ncbi:hypothetical protein CEXT_583451 [Caerostris extrusa]|uniref:Uncharacterized protein n=1 Tax=Caerostris extrusa TaxID=172846 RepID=A0AAV4RCC2_CAEEX|nr:hypothetical protein CEXT_583451 [Caerostris extrusa]
MNEVTRKRCNTSELIIASTISFHFPRKVPQGKKRILLASTFASAVLTHASEAISSLDFFFLRPAVPSLGDPFHVRSHLFRSRHGIFFLLLIPMDITFPALDLDSRLCAFSSFQLTY